MVADSIRRLLPEIMNEYLVRTVANAGLVQERRSPVRAPAQRPTKAAQRAQRLAGIDRPSSLREVLNVEETGADFYDHVEQALAGRMPQPRRSPAPVKEDYEFDFGDDDGSDPRETLREQVFAQRISQLPPQLQALAADTLQEGVDDDMVGEMWGEDELAPGIGEEPSMFGPKAPPLNIERAARVANVDFSRAQQLLNLSEQRAALKHGTPADRLAEAEWKEKALERKRRELDSIKVG